MDAVSPLLCPWCGHRAAASTLRGRVNFEDQLGRKLLICILLCSSCCAAIAFLALYAYQRARVSLDAERTHIAYLSVIDALYEYISDNDEWPKSWEALVDTDSLQGRYSDRNALTDIQTRVHVEFSLTLAEVAMMNVDDFSGVQPIGPNYGANDEGIRSIIELARERSPKTRNGTKGPEKGTGAGKGAGKGRKRGHSEFLMTTPASTTSGRTAGTSGGSNRST